MLKRLLSGCYRPLAGLLVVVVAASLPAHAQDAGVSATEAAATVAVAAVPYEVALDVTAPDDLEDDLQAASLLFGLRDKPPATVLGLRRRAEEDTVRLRRVLESEGYYAATIRHTVDASASPAQVTLSVDGGPRYTLAGLTVDYAAPGPASLEGLPQTLEDLAPDDERAAWVAVPGAPARSDTVLDAIDRAGRLPRERGYPNAEVVGHKATVNHADQTMTVRVTVAVGDRAVFGPTTISGADRVKADYLRRHQTWDEGAAYDIAAVEETRRSLLDTGLFDTVTIAPAGEVGADGQVPMQVTVAETDHRSIGAGARYSTSIGPAVSAFWEHRNLFGAEERLRVEGEVSPVQRRLGGTVSKPHFLHWDQTLAVSSEINDEAFEAYDRRAIEAFAGLTRRMTPELTLGAGVSLDYARISGHDEQEEDRRSSLVGLPLTLGYDTTDNLLDPRTGLRLAATATPYAGAYDGPVSFGKLEGEVSAYADLSGDGDTVLAGRLALGGIVGAARTGVPPDKRFYAGGGGSVRGYGFQLAGALDDQNDPIGGNSLIEGSLEIRQKITDTIGLVPFFDVGRAHEEAMPSLEGDLFMAVGLGGRYYSPIGPVRLDIAIPLDRRKDVDDSFQFYVSLGQAF